MFQLLMSRHTLMSQDAAPGSHGLWHDVFNPCEWLGDLSARGCLLAKSVPVGLPSLCTLPHLDSGLSRILYLTRAVPAGVHKCNGAETDCRTFWRKSRTAYMNEVRTALTRAMCDAYILFVNVHVTDVPTRHRMARVTFRMAVHAQAEPLNIERLTHSAWKDVATE